MTARDALEAMAAIRRLIGARRPILFLDYDGTLTPIRRRPEEAVLSAEARQALGALRRRHEIWIVSGRDADDVRRMVGLDGLGIIGNHGLERLEVDGTRRDHAEAARWTPGLAAVARHLNDGLANIPGAWVERKRFAVVAHDREVDDGRLEAVRRAVQAAHAVAPELRLVVGRRVHEFRPPVRGDKGVAVRQVLDERGGPDAVCPIYVGDDTTDEDALVAVADDGIGVRVRHDEQPSVARFTLADPNGVVAFLRALMD